MADAFDARRRAGGAKLTQRGAETTVSRHKFKVGQAVNYLGRERISGAYKIIQLMPPMGGDFQYRIRNINEPHDRVVQENDLDRAA